MVDFHPAWPFLVAALAALVTRGALRAAILVAAPLVGGLQFIDMPMGEVRTFQVLGMELVPYRADGLSLIFSAAFHIGALLSILFALRVRDTTQHVAAMVYVAASLGVLFAGDLLTLFAWWEVMGLSSAWLIFATRTRQSFRAGVRYLVYQVASGLLLMTGAAVQWTQTGSLAFGAMELGSLASWLILLAFGMKAGFPLLHAWIPDGYPNGTATGSVFLCIFTTKAAIYALARGFPGTELLIYVGAVMTCFPVFYAIIENDLRRVLSYSVINQLGFMVVGVGIGTELSLNGTSAHAFAHIIYKALLFMSMGALLQQAGTVKASELGGLYRKMPWTTTFCIVGAASISAFPLLSGFVAKAMVMSALLEEGYLVAWLMLLFASAGVLEHSGIKIPYFGFFKRHASPDAREAPTNMLLAMGLAAVLCIGIGLWPQALYDLLPYEMAFSPYDAAHVVTQLQLLLFATLAIVWMHRSGFYPREVPSTNLDVDWVFRKMLPAAAFHVRKWLGLLRDRSVRAWDGFADGLGSGRISNSLGQTWPTGSMALWVAILMAVLLLFGLR
jgi:multicomponent Na+:H+ antiporter subunit D